MEHKGSKDELGIFFSDGPEIFFDTFGKIFDFVKNYKHKIIFNLLLKILNISIYQYCNGINCVLSNRGIIIEDEYLITVSNDSFTIYEKMENFIEAIKDLNILTIEEINEGVQMTKTMDLINKLGFNAIIHLLFEHKDALEKEVDIHNFLEIELEKIIKISSEIYAKYKSMMKIRVKKIFYKELLRLTLCYYITRLLLIKDKKKIKKEDIINKIKKDKEILYDAYKDIIGENLINTTLQILDDIVLMLEIDINLISTPILTIRQYIGPAFTYSVATKIIELRNDLSKEATKDCENQCEDVLKNYQGPEGETSSFFQKLSSNIKENKKDKSYIKIRESQIKFGDELKMSNQKMSSEEDNEGNSELEEEVKYIESNADNDKHYINTNLKDFLDEENEDDDEEEEEEDDDEIKKDKEEDSKIDCQGFFKKKSGFISKKYYYQVKNNGLYLYEDQEAKIPKYKLSLKDAILLNPESKFTEFSLKLKEKNAEEKYEFKCNTEQEKNNLVKVITKAIKNSKNVIDGIQIKTIEIKERKMVIKDYLKEKNKIDLNDLEKRIYEYVEKCNYFKISEKNLKKQMEIIKAKRDKEIQMEKEEIKKKEKEKLKIKLRKSEEKKKKKESIGTNIKKFFNFIIGRKD